MGLGFDARNIDHIYNAPNLIFNTPLLPGKMIALSNLSIFPETDKIQEMDKAPLSIVADFVVDCSVSPEKNKRCIAAIEEGWRQIDKIGFDEYHKRTDSVGGYPLVTEGLVNINDMKDFNAIILHTEHVNSIDNDILFALALKGVMKKNYGVDLPIIHYEKKPENDLSLPRVSEIANINKGQIIFALENLPDSKAFGPEFIANIEAAFDRTPETSLKAMGSKQGLQLAEELINRE